MLERKHVKPPSLRGEQNLSLPSKKRILKIVDDDEQ